MHTSRYVYIIHHYTYMYIYLHTSMFLFLAGEVVGPPDKAGNAKISLNWPDKTRRLRQTEEMKKKTRERELIE